MRTTQAMLICSVACFSLACVSTGGPAGYAPPAWSEPGLIPFHSLVPFHYGLTRKAINTARGPFPRLVVRIKGIQSQQPILLWAEIPAAASKRQDLDDLPFLPIPNLPIALPAELENCSDFEVFVNPTPENPNSLGSEQDAIVTPLTTDRFVPNRGAECELVVFYGTLPERGGVWLQITSNRGEFFEQMIVKARPGFWVVVPFAAIGETAYSAAVTAAVLLAFAASGR